MAKLKTIFVLLSLVTKLDWPLQQFDFKNVFLHGDLEEEVYMEMPYGLKKLVNRNTISKLKKALCDLKQSSKAWFERFRKAMLGMKYKHSQEDHNLSIRKVITLSVHVDDIIVIGNDLEKMG